MVPTRKQGCVRDENLDKNQASKTAEDDTTLCTIEHNSRQITVDLLWTQRNGSSTAKGSSLLKLIFVVFYNVFLE